MTPKDLDTFIQSSIIMSVDRVYPIPFNKIVLNTLVAYGNDDNDLSRGLKSKLKQHGLDDIYKDILLKEGYIKRFTNSYDTFILTDKGILVQEAKGLTNYLKQTKRNRRAKIFKFTVLYILPMIVFLWAIIKYVLKFIFQ